MRLPLGTQVQQEVYVRAVDAPSRVTRRRVRFAVSRWIEGQATGAWACGVGAGFAGSFAYTGAFRGAPIDGLRYLEWIA